MNELKPVLNAFCYLFAITYPILIYKYLYQYYGFGIFVALSIASYAVFIGYLVTEFKHKR